MAWKRDNYGSRSRNDRGGRDDFGGHSYEPRPHRSSSSSSPGGDFGRAIVDRANVKATVKWFNATKGFGFVAPTDGSPDAFLHISVLERAGRSEVAEGTTVVCDLGQGQRGPQVLTIHEIDASTAVARSSSSSAGGGMGRRDSAPMSSEPIEGTVKFFSADKGFGFVALDDGGKDVFVHIKALERSGLRTLAPEQRVRMTVSMGLKGPQADTIAIV